MVSAKYITITGLNHYSGKKGFKIDSIIKLTKEPDNEYDSEAIICELRYYGKKGYVANSTHSVIIGTMSGGRLYDKIGDESFAKAKFIGTNFVIAQILNDEEIETLKKDNTNDIYYLTGKNNVIK